MAALTIPKKMHVENQGEIFPLSWTFAGILLVKLEQSYAKSAMYITYFWNKGTVCPPFPSAPFFHVCRSVPLSSYSQLCEYILPISLQITFAKNHPRNLLASILDDFGSHLDGVEGFELSQSKIMMRSDCAGAIFL